MIKETKKEKYTKIQAILEQSGADENLINFVKSEIDYLDEKTQKNRERVTAKKQENAELCERIDEVMEGNPDQVYSIGDIISNVPECNNLSTQKVGALMTMLVNTNRVTRIFDKRKRYFQYNRHKVTA